MSLIEDRLQLLGFPAPWRRALPPPAPPLADLVRESGQAAAKGEAAATEAYGPSTRVAGDYRELPATRDLPDPHGPDPVVFGDVPCAGPGLFDY